MLEHIRGPCDRLHDSSQGSSEQALKGSEKALRQIQNFSNSNPPPHGASYKEAHLVLGKSTLDFMQMAPQGALLRGTGHLLE